MSSNKTIFKTNELRKEYSVGISDMLDQQANVEGLLVMSKDDTELTEQLNSILDRIKEHIEDINKFVSRIPRVAKIRQKDVEIAGDLLEDNDAFMKDHYSISKDIAVLISEKFNLTIDAGDDNIEEILEDLKGLE